MIWLMEVFKIYLEEQLLIKYYVIKHFKLKKSNIWWISKRFALMVCKFVYKMSSAARANKFAGSTNKIENMPGWRRITQNNY